MLKEIIFGLEPVIARGRPFVPLSYEEVYRVLETAMGLVPASDIEGIQFHGPNPRRIDVLPRNHEVWIEKDLFQHMNQSYELENGTTVLITRPYEEYTTVRVKRIPMWFSVDEVKRIFNWYGDVVSIDKEVYRSNSRIREDFYGIKTGNYTLKMKLKANSKIPSTLTVSGERFEIFYNGQEQMCWRCGMGHRKFECNTRYKDFVNRFSMDQFPPLAEPRLVIPVISEDEASEQEPEETRMYENNENTETVIENASESIVTENISTTTVTESMSVTETIAIVTNEPTESDIPATSQAINTVTEENNPGDEFMDANDEPTVFNAITTASVSQTTTTSTSVSTVNSVSSIPRS